MVTRCKHASTSIKVKRSISFQHAVAFTRCLNLTTTGLPPLLKLIDLTSSDKLVSTQHFADHQACLYRQVSF